MAVTLYSDAELELALELAKQALLASFGRAAEPVESLALAAPGCCFVTLTLGGELRGCIGSLEPRQSLARDLIDNSRSAAFADPRFPRLSEHELEQLYLEVSILGPHAEIDVSSERALIEKLVPEADGLVMVYSGMRATFLPSVWEQLPEAEAFIRALKRKAGLPGDFWSEEMRWYRYRVQKTGGPLLTKG